MTSEKTMSKPVYFDDLYKKAKGRGRWESL